jgi:hypothetical protein
VTYKDLCYTLQNFLCFVDRAAWYNLVTRAKLVHNLFLVYIFLAYEGGPKYNWNLKVAPELEVVARCAARCRESTQYSSSLPRDVSLG